MSDLIFVYGILKSTESTMMDHCTFIAKGTAQGCALVELGGCPGLFPCRVRPGDYAKGEVYKADDIEKVLRYLDSVEQEGTLYKRVCMPIHIANNKVLDCWVYVYMLGLDPEQIILGGIWNGH